MSIATGSQNDKVWWYIIMTIVILIIIATIIYFIFFKNEEFEPSDTTHTTEEQLSDDTKIEKDKEETKKEDKKYIYLASRSTNVLNETSKEGLQIFEESHIPAIFEKHCRYESEFMEIDTIIGIKLFDALETFFKTDINWVIKSLKERKKQNQYIRTPDFPGILDTSKLFNLFDKTNKEIYEKYNSKDNLLDNQMDLEFLDSEYINYIFEDDDIKGSINLEHFRKAKKPLFKNIPISILIDLEISLLEIKRSILKYVSSREVRFLIITTLLNSETEKMKGNEMNDELKNTTTQLNLVSSNKEDLKTIIAFKDNLLKEVNIAMEENKEISRQLYELNAIIIGKKEFTNDL